MMTKKVASLEELSKKIQEYYDILNKEPNDLSVVMISASFLESCLESILTRFFVEDKNIVHDFFSQSLDSLANKINCAFLLGLISEYMRHDLDLIREIRNKFAHNFYEVKFEDENIRMKCDQLQFLKIAFESHHNPTNSPSIFSLFKMAQSPREKFSLTAMMIVQFLIVSGLSIKHREKDYSFVKHKKPN